MSKKYSFFESIGILPLATRLLIRTPSLWKWSLPPVILSLVVVILSFTWINQFIDQFILERIIGNMLGNLLEGFPTLLKGATWLAHFFSIGISVLTLSVTFSWIFILLSIPFCDPLADATEKALGIHPSFQKNFVQHSFFKLILIDLNKSLFVIFLQMCVLGGTLLFFWIPGIQVIAFIINAWLLAFQFLTYPQTRRGLGLFKSFQNLRKRPLLVWTFGASLSLLYFVPYGSALLTPIAVIAGTVLYSKIEYKN